MKFGAVYLLEKLEKEGKKNILFICGSLEPGKDGVGDYTYTLSKQIKDHYQTLHIAAFNDKHIVAKTCTKIVEDNIILVRLSSNTNLKERYDLLKRYIAENNISFISLQFVPFSFHHKGLPLRFILKISKIKQVNWHIMFHELWVAMEKNASLKMKILRFLQFHIIKALIKRLKPKIIHTSNPLYIHQIKTLTKTCSIKELPLFGNIKKASRKNLSQQTLNKVHHIVLFAGIHHGAPVGKFVHWLKKELQVRKSSAKFTFIGNNGPFLKEWTEVLAQNSIKYQVLGSQDNDTISHLLFNADLGITTTPYYLSNKSGSNAAMLEHQLTVLCVARNWIPDVNIELSSLSPQNVTEWHLQQTLDEIYKPKYVPVNSLSNVGEQFINNLSPWHL